MRFSLIAVHFFTTPPSVRKYLCIGRGMSIEGRDQNIGGFCAIRRISVLYEVTFLSALQVFSF
jgi:hypothetical protein